MVVKWFSTISFDNINIGVKGFLSIRIASSTSWLNTPRLVEEVVKSKSEGEITKPKRRYSKRKPSSRRGQSRVKGRRPYTSRKKSDAETISVKGQESTKPLEFEENSLHAVPEKVDPPIIPLPAPFVRSDSRTISETETEGDNSSSVPDGKVN